MLYITHIIILIWHCINILCERICPEILRPVLQHKKPYKGSTVTCQSNTSIEIRSYTVYTLHITIL